MGFHVPEQYRIRTGLFASNAANGNNGAFFIPCRAINAGKSSPPFKVIASDGEGWEHVSVSLPHRTPTWAEMCWIKSLFWGPADCVVQYHPPEQDYVNNHQFCLHMWSPVGIELPRPPGWMVGVKDLGVMA